MLTPGIRLQGRYQIIRPLGQGGMGAVYLAADLRLGQRPVVVKENLGGDPRQFQIEANILAALIHPNLPRVIDHFVESSNTQYLVMDYVEGRNLDEIVRQNGPLPEQTALAYMQQILEAVRYLHQNQVIHRDIKPQNIIITPQNKAVLVDFGIAKVLATGQSTSSSARFGSPGYAPPEQYSGGTTERSDVYALGATLYFALTGRTPPDATMRAAGTLLTAPRLLNSKISLKTERAILKAMELLMAGRFPSAAELQKALAGQPIARKDVIALVSVSGIALVILAFILPATGSFLSTRAVTPTPLPTLAAQADRTHISTATLTPIDPRATQTMTLGRLPSASFTPTPSMTTIPTVTATPSMTTSPTSTPRPTLTAVPTATATPSRMPTRTATRTMTPKPPPVVLGEFRRLWQRYQARLGAPQSGYESPRNFSEMAEQPFEKGHLFATGKPDKLIIVVVEKGRTGWQQYADTWREGDDNQAPCAAARSSPAQIRRGFGRLWCERNLYAAIGYATAEEINIDLIAGKPIYLIQRFQEGTILRDSDGWMNGRAYVFFADGTFVREGY